MKNRLKSCFYFETKKNMADHQIQKNMYFLFYQEDDAHNDMGLYLS